ncbi:MAG: AraC family transcriptional regulator [Hydrogenophilales bacterium 17-61-9]|nr:MAG: AraC family transcriptional regulator [Hydrogenophilales bacterium 17-61-9]
MIHKHAGIDPGIAHSHFNTQGEAPHRQLLAWRDRVGHIVDVLPALAHVAQGFSGRIDRYTIGDLVFTDSRTNPLKIERSVARISTDNTRCYVFQVAMEGGLGTVAGLYRQRNAAQSGLGILALDMNQPFRMQRPACRVLTFFVPRPLVESSFPDADALHGRFVADTSPLTRMVCDHLAALNRNLTMMSASAVDSALRACAHLLVATFGKQMRLTGNARAAARAALFGQVRRHIRAHLHQAHLSPESVLTTLQLPRPTLYRMFEHEGGIGAYIRNLRLREAADELVKFPHMAVMDIAYGLGFKSASDFTRAFRRAYDMAPQDLRAQVSGSQRAQVAATANTDSWK